MRPPKLKKNAGVIITAAVAEYMIFVFCFFFFFVFVFSFLQLLHLMSNLHQMISTEDGGQLLSRYVITEKLKPPFTVFAFL